MRIKIWASLEPQFPNRGPYKALDIIKRDLGAENPTLVVAIGYGGAYTMTSLRLFFIPT